MSAAFPTMKSFLVALTAFLALGAPMLHATDLTALQAVKLLPAGAVARLCRIEARDGAPHPTRWHLLVYDPTQASGLREFVVAGSEIVASRSISQFAETLGPRDVINISRVSIDSDDAAERVRQFAAANNVPADALNYRLFRESSGTAPLWHIENTDASGNVLATLDLTATRGTLVSKKGFPIEPQKSTLASVELAVYASSSIAPKARFEDMIQPTPPPRPTVRRPRREPGKGGIHKVGNTLKKFFTGR